MNKLEKKIETFANVAIIVTALLCVGFGIYTFFPREMKTAELSAQLKGGDKFSLSGIDWAKNKQTLVLLLQKGCHFCEESYPFYQRLIKTDTAKAKLVAVLPTPVEESQAYLKSFGVGSLEIRQTEIKNLGIRGTPTLVLVDEQGSIVDMWIGKLKPEDEEKVLEKIS
jgi:thioredoxin-related protein